MNNSSPHSFHIPVMGLAYTIDSPIKVARFGISSVMSIIEDRLVEMMRKHYYTGTGREYVPISNHEDDYRAKRITDYLNLVNSIVKSQMENLRNSAFEAGSEIVKYFDMLPDENPLRQFYTTMMRCSDPSEKKRMADYLRSKIVPGSIDVNIMTKTDRNNYSKNGELLTDGSDAVSALRGYANSALVNSSVVFSAGMNPRLYDYLGTLPAFEVNADASFDKKVIIKVSDYRSALIQGKFLAKKGIWVSEFRIESGLNCGGHAFATDGYLLGPILEEFKTRKDELIESLLELYNQALLKKGKANFIHPPSQIFSVQGGIGTSEEDRFLHQQYDISSTGWGTPFLLVPEATTVDEATLKLLTAAKQKDVVLSKNSPLGIRFYYLKGTSAEIEKFSRIKAGKPGSPCTEKHLGFNSEFTKELICTASHKYQKLKIAQLKSLDLPEELLTKQANEVLDKECLCIGLSNAAALIYKQPFIKKLNAVTICPGPNIAYFNKEVSLKEMTDHIYGRGNILNRERPHFFINELQLYIDYLKEQLIENMEPGQFMKKKKYYTSFLSNLRAGIKYYRQVYALAANEAFIKALYYAEIELDAINYQFEIEEIHAEC